LDRLISDLAAGKCEGIREKLADVANNSSKFKSTVSELEIARILIQHKKIVKLLPDGYMGRDTAGDEIPSPDILTRDETGDYYVEVSMFSDDETSGLIIDDLRPFLAASAHLARSTCHFQRPCRFPPTTTLTGQPSMLRSLRNLTRSSIS
jgi:hypothetical protein